MAVKRWRGYASAKAVRTQRVEIVDGKGKLRAVFGTGGFLGDGVHLAVLGEEDGSSTSLGMHEDGQAYLAVSGGESGKGMKLSAGPDGSAGLTATGEGSPVLYLGADEEGGDPISYLVLADSDGQGSVAITGRKTGSFVRLSDGRGEIRASLEVADDGEPALHRVDRDGYPYGPRGRLYRTLNEASVVYQALLAVAFLVASAVFGAWIAGAASSSTTAAFEGPLTLGVTAAMIVVFAVLTLLFLYLVRQKG